MGQPPEDGEDGIEQGHGGVARCAGPGFRSGNDEVDGSLRGRRRMLGLLAAHEGSTPPFSVDALRSFRLCRPVQDKNQQPTLGLSANASRQGLVATGPRRGCRVLRLGTTGDGKTANLTGKRCADVAGFNVHANPCARANERDRLEILVKYLARPPIANDRLSELPDGRLALQVQQAWRDDSTHLVFTPHELATKLIPLIRARACCRAPGW
jgi:hypothetical protein